MEVSDILSRLSRVKRDQGPILEYINKRDKGIFERVKNCGTWLEFRDFLAHNETRLKRGNFCQKKYVCRACSRRWALKAAMAYNEKLQMIENIDRYIPAMVTITVKSGYDLAERVKHLAKSWSKMTTRVRQHWHNPARYSPVEWCKVVGSVRALEVTTKGVGAFCRTGTLWHPHFHVFVLLDRYIDHSKFKAEWKKITGDSFIVDIRKCRNGPMSALLEVIKYTTKFSDMEPRHLWKAHKVLKGKPSLVPLGKFRGVKVPEIDGDDLDLDGPYYDWYVEWLFGEQKYMPRQYPYNTPQTAA